MSPRRVYDSIGTLSWYTVKQSQSTNWRIVTLETSQDYDRDRSEDILNTIYNQYDTYCDFDRDLDTPWHVVIEINWTRLCFFFKIRMTRLVSGDRASCQYVHQQSMGIWYVREHYVKYIWRLRIMSDDEWMNIIILR